MGLIDLWRMRKIRRLVGHLDGERLRSLGDELEGLARGLRDLALELGNISAEYFGTEIENVYLLRDAEKCIWRAYDILLAEFGYYLAEIERGRETCTRGEGSSSGGYATT